MTFTVQRYQFLSIAVLLFYKYINKFQTINSWYTHYREKIRFFYCDLDLTASSNQIIKGQSKTWKIPYRPEIRFKLKKKGNPFPHEYDDSPDFFTGISGFPRSASECVLLYIVISFSNEKLDVYSRYVRDTNSIANTRVTAWGKYLRPRRIGEILITLRWAKGGGVAFDTFDCWRLGAHR